MFLNPFLCNIEVALLAEGVDRNTEAENKYRDTLVALLAEGVDRNRMQNLAKQVEDTVALLAEGVDRNFMANAKNVTAAVALLAEGVDRNHCADVVQPEVFRRPPRGGRG